MDKPVKTVYLAERGLTRLDMGRADHPRNGDYYFRGGIYWPESGVSPGQSPVGYAVMLGMQISSRKVYVFDEQEFIVIDHILRADGGIGQTGLGPWFNEMWKTYYCRTFYYNQPESLHRMFLLQTIRSRMIEPKPYFVELLWQDNREPWGLVITMGEAERLRMTEGCGVQNGLHQYVASPDGKLVPPSVWALMCAVYGMERYPWREPRRIDDL